MPNVLPTRSISWLLVSTLIILSLAIPVNLLLPAPVIAQGGTFPASPFNGMQITYSISGATVTDTKDTEGFTTSRALNGKLGTGQLTISGSAKMGSGYDADVTATVSCGGKTDKFTTNIKSGYPGFNSESFNISVPIPKGSTSGSFSINMTGHYNAGNRGLVVSGTFAADPGASVPPSTEKTAQIQEDPPPGPLINKLPDRKGVESHRCFIEEIAGNPIYISADSPSLPPSQRKWVKFMPGDKNILLYADWTVRTPSGSETVIRFATGAVSRQKERSWFDVQPKIIQTTPVSVVMGRLWDGIANFYFPKGAAGAKKFEIGLNRVHTGIKGTNFVVEVTEQKDTVKVIEGTVEITFDETGDVKMLEAGQQISATKSGLGNVSSFNVQDEKAKWKSFYQALDGSGVTSEEVTEKKSPFNISSIKCPLKAAYQSEYNPRLALFREFRDRVLLTSAPGTVAVDLYYTYGPAVARILNESELLRIVVRDTLIEPLALAIERYRPLWDLYARILLM